MPASPQTITVAGRYDYSGVEVSEEDWAIAHERIASTLDELGARISDCRLSLQAVAMAAFGLP